MMRIQFIKATPSAVVRGEWFAVDIRIVNESNSTVKITSKIFASVSLVDHIGALLEGSSILDVTLESPAHFVERGKKQSSKFAVLPSGCLKLWVRVSLRCNGLHYIGKTHTDKCMHHIRHPLRLKINASAASSSAAVLSMSILPLYSAAFTVIGPDSHGDTSEAVAEGSLSELCSEAGESWSSCSDGSAPGWRCVEFQGNRLFFQESPSHARECTGTVVWDGALMLLDFFCAFSTLICWEKCC